MEFVILGKVATPKEDLKKEIQKMGGKVTTKIHKKLAAVISTQGRRNLVLCMLIPYTLMHINKYAYNFIYDSEHLIKIKIF